MSNFTTERGFLFPSFDPLEEEGERIALVKRKWTMGAADKKLDRFHYDIPISLLLSIMLL